MTQESDIRIYRIGNGFIVRRYYWGGAFEYYCATIEDLLEYIARILGGGNDAR